MRWSINGVDKPPCIENEFRQRVTVTVCGMLPTFLWLLCNEVVEDGGADSQSGRVTGLAESGKHALSTIEGA